MDSMRQYLEAMPLECLFVLLDAFYELPIVLIDAFDALSDMKGLIYDECEAKRARAYQLEMTAIKACNEQNRILELMKETDNRSILAYFKEKMEELYVEKCGSDIINKDTDAEVWRRTMGWITYDWELKEYSPTGQWRSIVTVSTGCVTVRRELDC